MIKIHIIKVTREYFETQEDLNKKKKSYADYAMKIFNKSMLKNIKISKATDQF